MTRLISSPFDSCSDECPEMQEFFSGHESDKYRGSYALCETHVVWWRSRVSERNILEAINRGDFKFPGETLTLKQRRKREKELVLGLPYEWEMISV